MKYKSIIVLSHQLTPDWELSGESKLRVEKGVELLKMDCAKYFYILGVLFYKAIERFLEALGKIRDPKAADTSHF